MTLGDYRPKAISEWGDVDGHIDDCGWRSTTMLANKASRGAYPATQAESEKLGQGASSITDNNTALGREYGWHAQPYDGDMPGFLKLLTPGRGALVQGYYAGLPVHYQRFDPGFAAKGSQSRHATYVQREPDGRIWWIDPLFHGEPGYAGEYITAAALSAYATTYHTKVLALLALEGSHDPSQSGPAIPEAPVSTFTPKPGLLKVGSGTPIYDAPDLSRTPIGRFTSDSAHTERLGEIAGWRVAVVAIGTQTLAAWLPGDGGPTAPPLVDIEPGPPTAPDCSAARAAGFEDAIAQGTAALAALKPKARP